MDLSKKRIVVTGGAGFLGSFVVEALTARGCQNVFVPRSREYDLVDMSAVRRLLDDARPDVIIHLAARVGGILANQQNPGRFFYDNLMMGVQLLDESRRFGVEKFVATGTICAYPKHTPVPFREDDLWNGYPEETNAPYGLAKKMLLVQSQAYRAQYGFSSVVLFPVNLYGPRDNFDLTTSHVIPALIRKVVEAMRAGRDEVPIWGDGTPTREFLYVADCAEGIVLATERFDDSQPVNLGSGQEISIATLAQQIGNILGFRGRFVYDQSRPNGQPRRALDCSRAEKLFGFRATTGFETGLRRTIDFYLRELST
ncbi:MAG TPA: GDP-L-fucose synthase [Pseudomonadota bacterium]|nr:GDP-L-fucose synthase [Pseudomonadota bacterium]HND12186.1 GDP-L-fucose synthase [Pseudomonadota bacterium]HNI60716.1 GDP-L-fucose synthase [Pseudomonadota bacterium]HNK46159.1 GDP-L-fucose synthase [Pseudomonadota bacterium]HNN54155.1 GDP-L-fucose synthase [Pseudomonadota bacterium]